MEPLFNIDLLRSQIVNKSWLPPTGTVVAAADTAFTDGERSDRSVLCAGKVVETDGRSPDGRSVLWIMDVVADRTPPRELPRTIATFLRKHNPTRTVIEKVNGSMFLLMAMEVEFRRVEISPRIEWISANKEKGGKVPRIEKLIRLSADNRLRLVAGAWVSDFVEECERWTGTRRNCSRLDDMVDSASLLTRFI